MTSISKTQLETTCAYPISYACFRGNKLSDIQDDLYGLYLANNLDEPPVSLETLFNKWFKLSNRLLDRIVQVSIIISGPMKKGERSIQPLSFMVGVDGPEKIESEYKRINTIWAKEEKHVAHISFCYTLNVLNPGDLAIPETLSFSYFEAFPDGKESLKGVDFSLRLHVSDTDLIEMYL